MALSMTTGQEPAAAQGNRFWIREAAAEDSAAVVQIIHAAYAEFQGKLDPPSGAHAETEASIHKLFETERCVIAGWGEEVAGCTFFHIGERDTYLHRLAVVPEHRRKALGHALVTFAETQARAAGSPRVRLGVRLQLPTNQVFYRSLGYSVTSHHSHPGYSYPTYVSMTKDMSEPPQRVIEVVAPNPAWPRQYDVEAQLLRLVFGSELVAIHHVGSTAITGIYAKPIIDTMPVVRDIEAVDSFNPVLESLGYKAWGENGIAGRRYFTRGTTKDAYARYSETGRDYVENVSRLLRKFNTARSLVPPSVLRSAGGVTGVFLDPPYDLTMRAAVYANESGCAADVLRWCAANGANPDLRIVLAGYDGAHNDLQALGWRVHEWSTAGGYGAGRGGRGEENATKERLWFSPHCIDDPAQRRLL